MRYFIYFIGILIAVVFITQGKSAFEHRSILLNSNKSISTEVDSLNKTLTWLNNFQPHQPQTLLSSYEDFLNNVFMIANANQASVLVRSKQGTTDKDIKISPQESPYSGVNQVDLEVTVRNLTNFNKLSAIFSAFSNLESSTPIIIHGFFQEKDYVLFNVSVLGV